MLCWYTKLIYIFGILFKFSETSILLMFQRCIIIELFYFSVKQVDNGTCITAVRGKFSICTVVPRPLSNDPRFSQCIYRYSRASKRFVEVYLYKSHITWIRSFSVYNDSHLSLNQQYYSRIYDDK